MKEMTSFGSASSSEGTCSICKDTKPVFGIDLGTTNSAISVVKEGNASEYIPLAGGRRTMPSCVMWHHNEFIVGLEAYEKRDQDNVVYSVKRLMQDAQATVTFVDGNDSLVMTPAEVSAEILKALVKETGGVFGEIVDVVVTVPAYFNQIGRDNTRKACVLAGLNPISIINEPTAASLCYEIDTMKQSDEVVVYDLGGGTFDITIARINSTEGLGEIDDIYGLESRDECGEDGKSISVLATAGDSHLGGDDLDLYLYGLLCAKLRDRGVDPDKFKKSFRENLILRLEHWKKKGADCRISMKIETIDTDGRGIKTEVSMLPSDFAEATAFIYHKTRRLLKKVLRENPTKAKNLVLAGGSTRNVILQEFLKKDFPEFVVNNALDPDLSVANGAAIHGKSVKFGDANVVVFDILPITIGVLDDGKVLPFIKSGTCLPAVNTCMFTTTRDNQENLRIKVLQGDSVYADDCIALGDLVIKNIDPKPAGAPNLYVTISVSADSIMTCRASVDGREQSLKLNLAGEAERVTSQNDRVKKSIIRWRRLAQKCEDRKLQEKLQAAIDAYESANTAENKQNVIALVKEVDIFEGEQG